MKPYVNGFVVFIRVSIVALVTDSEVKMKKAVCFLISLSVLISVSYVWADTAGLMSQADDLFTPVNGTMDNYQKSIDLYKQILAAEPDNFEATWKCARSLRFYAYTAHQKNVEGWKKTCATIGKEGMNYAQKAIELRPDQPDGYYYYGLNVGIYSDGVSILTALKEGLKDKTQNSFEKVLELNPDYEKAGAVLSLGRFWSVLPWPLKKKDKALEYFRRYQETQYFGELPEGIIYYVELLIDMGGKKNKEEARQLLGQLNTDNPFFVNWGRDLQNKL